MLPVATGGLNVDQLKNVVMLISSHFKVIHAHQSHLRLLLTMKATKQWNKHPWRTQLQLDEDSIFVLGSWILLHRYLIRFAGSYKVKTGTNMMMWSLLQCCFLVCGTCCYAGSSADSDYILFQKRSECFAGAGSWRCKCMQLSETSWGHREYHKNGNCFVSVEK